MLRIAFRNRHRNLPKAEGLGSGPEGRISKMRKLVTALVRHERIEGKAFYLDESRGYAELLIQQAQRYGDTHKPTMELADYWLLEKDLIHKLFKVLAPRYQNYTTSFTSIHRLPSVYPGSGVGMGVLELKGNPWPPVVPHHRDNSRTLVNVLLEAARNDYKWRHGTGAGLAGVGEGLEGGEHEETVERLEEQDGGFLESETDAPLLHEKTVLDNKRDSSDKKS